MALMSCAGTTFAAACRIVVACPAIGFGGRVLRVNAGVCLPATTSRVAAVWASRWVKSCSSSSGSVPGEHAGVFRSDR